MKRPEPTPGVIPVAGAHIQLLVAVILQLLMLAVAPPGSWQQGANLLFTVWMAMAAATVTGRRRDFWVLVVLGVTPAVLTLLVPDAAAPLALALFKEACWAAFPFYMAFRLFLALYFSRRITHAELAGAITVYLLLGLAFANVFEITFLLNPESLSFSYLGVDGLVNFGDLLYFSYVTLATLGYGDVAPLSAEARLVAAGEAILGLLYVAIMVARLVSLHVLSDDGIDGDPGEPS